MSQTGIGKLLHMILVLILGAGDPRQDGGPPADVSGYAAYAVPLRAELNVKALRKAARDIPDIAEAVLSGVDADKAAAGVAERMGVPSTALKNALGRVRLVGFRVLHFGPEAENFRFLAVLDVGAGEPLLPPLLAARAEAAARAAQNGAGRREGYTVVQYGDDRLHGLRFRGDGSLWFVERAGTVVLASDAVALQEYLLGARTRTPGEASRPDGGAILRVEGNGPVILNHLLASVRRRNREEMAAVCGMLDLAAVRSVAVTLGTNGLTAKAELDRTGVLARALAGTSHLSPLLACLPDGCGLVAAVAPGNPAELWSAVRSGIDQVNAADGRPDRYETFAREFRKETGLDIQSDIVSNVTAAALVVPSLAEGERMNRNWVFAGQVRDPVRAEASLRAVVATTARDSEKEAATSEDGNCRVWTTSECRAAIAGATVLFASERRAKASFEAVRSQLARGRSGLAGVLETRHPAAFGLAVLTPGSLNAKWGGEPVTAGLTFRGNSLELNTVFDAGSLARSLMGAAAEANRDAAKARSANHLRMVAMACLQHMNDRGAAPNSLEDLRPYLGGRSDVLVSPICGKPYVYRPAPGSLMSLPTQDRAKALLVHEPVECARDGGFAAFADGHVEWLARDRFEALTVRP
jgi:hypothetical protein